MALDEAVHRRRAWTRNVGLTSAPVGGESAHHRGGDDLAGCGIYGVNADGQIIFANRAAQEMMSWTTENLLGRDEPGKLALAHGGTPFLDEVTKVPLEMQDQLLNARPTDCLPASDPEAGVGYDGAAALFGIQPTTLYSRIEKLGLTEVDRP
ncbi:PAS domain-containing protein [Actibacterium sp. 188UL27-1]|uniref:PAS domain-containing protein n=1 Tax=Actibacterium sp. 188UL27-1 TaxID=2786961 RepID=UPI00351C4F7F